MNICLAICALVSISAIGCSKPVKYTPANLLNSSMSERLIEIVETAATKSGQNTQSGGNVVSKSEDKASAYKLQQVKGTRDELKEFMGLLEDELLEVLTNMSAKTFTHSSIQSPSFQETAVIQVSWIRVGSSGVFNAVAVPTDSGWTVYVGITESGLQ